MIMIGNTLFIYTYNVFIALSRKCRSNKTLLNQTVVYYKIIKNFKDKKEEK